MTAYRKLPPKSGRGARPVTRKLMEQANALDKALRAIKKLVPTIAQLEDDFDLNLVDAVTREARLNKLFPVTDAETGARKAHGGDMPTPPCWRCNREMTPSARVADGEINGKVFDPTLDEWVTEPNGAS
jgi:hypothetical protein